MSDERNNALEESDTPTALESLGSIVGDLATAIPAPIRRNVFKAFGRLLSVATEYPVTLIEGAIEERKAEARARVKLIDTVSTQIAEQLNVSPEYARIATAKHTEKIIRERMNIDHIVRIAKESIEGSVSAKDNLEDRSEVSDDWLNTFEAEAVKMTSSEMQLLFGRILAGEIIRPKSFSMKTIKFMAQLDNKAAILF